MKSESKNAEDLWRVSLRTKPDEEEAINEQLFTLNGSYPAVHQRPHEKTIRIEAFFRSRIAATRAQRLLARFSPSVDRLAHENWAESWKKHFGLQRCGKRIVIKPSWKQYRSRPDDVVIELDPGLSFGTGQHATTRFCLRMIERIWDDPRRFAQSPTLCFAPRACVPTPPKQRLRRLEAASQSRRRFSLLDIGAGSGILAIAASKLGYSPVLAIDNDPQAILVSGANALANAVSLRVRRLALHELLSTATYDVVVANILADVLIARRRKLASLVNHGGFLILAGILAREAEAVARAFRRLGLAPFACETKWNWAGFVLRKTKGRDHEQAARDC